MKLLIIVNDNDEKNMDLRNKHENQDTMVFIAESIAIANLFLINFPLAQVLMEPQYNPNQLSTKNYTIGAL